MVNCFTIDRACPSRLLRNKQPERVEARGVIVFLVSQKIISIENMISDNRIIFGARLVGPHRCGANVIRANLRGALSQSAAIRKSVRQCAPTDSTSTGVQERRISKRERERKKKIRRLPCDLKFILDYGLLRASTTGVPTPVRDDVSSETFSACRENSYRCNYVFPRGFGPFCHLRRLLPTRVIRCASDDPQQHSLLFTADTKADVRNMITVIMKIHDARESGRFILLTFRWLTVYLRLVACSFEHKIFLRRRTFIYILFDKNLSLLFYLFSSSWNRQELPDNGTDKIIRCTELACIGNARSKCAWLVNCAKCIVKARVRKGTERGQREGSRYVRLHLFDMPRHSKLVHHT